MLVKHYRILSVHVVYSLVSKLSVLKGRKFEHPQTSNLTAVLKESLALQELIKKIEDPQKGTAKVGFVLWMLRDLCLYFVFSKTLGSYCCSLISFL